MLCDYQIVSCKHFKIGYKKFQQSAVLVFPLSCSAGKRVLESLCSLSKYESLQRENPGMLITMMASLEGRVVKDTLTGSMLQTSL